MDQLSFLSEELPVSRAPGYVSRPRKRTDGLDFRPYIAATSRPSSHHPTARPSKVDRRDINQLRDILKLAPQLAHALTGEEHGPAACLDTRLFR
jgi:hypothetical protein